MSITIQALCTGIVCLISLSSGIMIAWPSSTLMLFRSTNTTLDRPMGRAELALFGSSSSIGALVGTPVAGYLLDRLGRKYSAVLTSLTYVIAWSIVSVCTQVEMILIAAFISGMGCAVVLVVRVYISEICQESIRGAMGTCSLIFYSCGLLLSYTLGGCLQYYSMAYACLSVAVFGTAMIAAMRESPTFLMKKGLEQDAAKSFAFYRNAKVDSKEVLEAMKKLRRAFNLDLAEELDLLHEEQKLEPTTSNKVKLSLWTFVKKSPSTRQAIFLTLMVATAANFQGFFAVQVYSEPLFKEAVPNMSATLCSVVQAILSVTSALIAGYLSDFSGRRPLMIYSSIAAGVCCGALGSQLHLNWAPHWLTAVFVYMFCIAYTFGAGTVPFILVTDVFLPEVKSIMSMLVIEWVWLCSSILLFIFNPLISAIGLGPVFYLFALMCALSAAFSFFCQPETKGLSVDAVQMLLVKRR